MKTRREKFIEIAFEIIVNVIHTIWDCEKNNVINLIFLNVMKAFDNVSHQKLIYNLRIKRVFKLIINWIKSFLVKMVTSIILNNKINSIKVIEIKISQGLFILSILFLFFNASFIKKCFKIKLKLQIRDFVNDIHFLIYEKFIKINYLILKKVYTIYQKWILVYEIIFISKKYELIHFSHNLNQFNIIIIINLKKIIKISKTSIKMLRLYINKKFH